MERLYQMHVVPDLVPAIHPSLDLRITTGFRPKGIHPKAKNPMIVEPGSYLLSKQTSRPPTLYATVYHTDTRLYTLVLIDPGIGLWLAAFLIGLTPLQMFLTKKTAPLQLFFIG